MPQSKIRGIFEYPKGSGKFRVQYFELIGPEKLAVAMMKDFYDIARGQELEHPEKVGSPKPQKETNVIAFSKPK
jgi:hypothetical protein